MKLRIAEKVLDDKNKGILFLLLSAFSFACMNTLVHMAGDLPSIQKSFFRNVVSLLVALIIVLRQKVPMRVEAGTKKLVFFRSLAGTIGLICNFYAVDHMILSDASMLAKMSPFFVLIFSRIILKEKVKKAQWLFICTAFVGSLFILKPSGTDLLSPAAMAALLGALMAGFAQTMIRLLGKRNVARWTIIFYFSVLSCVVTLPIALVTYEPMEPRQVLILVGAGAAATVGQFGVTSAYFYAPASEISVYDFSLVVFSAILGYIFFHQLADGYSFLGYFTVCTSAVLMFLYNNRRSGTPHRLS